MVSVEPSYWLIIAGLPTFFALQFITAPYGKFSPASHIKHWGPRIPSRAAWLIQETPSLYVSLLTFVHYANKAQYQSSGNRLLLGLFLWHYLWRSVILPLTTRSATPMPVVVCVLSIVFCVCNGFIQGYAIGNTIPPFAIGELSLAQWTGIAVFAMGWCLNQCSDYTLRSLRKPGDTSYHIPHGGLFEYVSAANYCSELIEWIGFALACQSLAAASFALYTFANLAPRARDTHRFYRDKFKERYPSDRKAFIPFLW